MSAVFLYFSVFIVIFIMLVFDGNVSYIGEAGRRNRKIEATFFIIIGIILFLDCAKIWWDNGFEGNIVILIMFLGFFGFIFVAVGILVMHKMNGETSSEVVTVKLINCKVIDHSKRFNKGKYFMISGNTLHGGKQQFIFTGKDMAIIRNAMSAYAIDFEISYYKNSGRMINVRF